LAITIFWLAQDFGQHNILAHQCFCPNYLDQHNILADSPLKAFTGIFDQTVLVDELRFGQTVFDQMTWSRLNFVLIRNLRIEQIVFF
jgi:hypothetical protein